MENSGWTQKAEKTQLLADTNDTQRLYEALKTIYHTIDHLSEFSEKKNGWSTLNFGSTGPRWSKISDFEPIIARSTSAIIPSEKKLN